MMESFTPIMSPRRPVARVIGRVHVVPGRTIDELDLLRFRPGKVYVAAAEGILTDGLLGPVFAEHNTFVPKKQRGQGAMMMLYRDLLEHGVAITSDWIAHSPPMRRTWLRLSRYPDVFVFADSPALRRAGWGRDVIQRVYADTPYDSVLLDGHLAVVQAPDEGAARVRAEDALNVTARFR